MVDINVVIVEDNSLLAEDIALKLTNKQMNVLGIYHSGEQALESMQLNLPDLVVMDIHLAGQMDGIVAGKIIGETYGIPVIYLSNDVDDSTVKRAVDTHPSAYLAKPFNELEMVRAINIAFTNYTDNRTVRRAHKKDHVFLKDRDSHVKVPYDQIICLEAGRSYCKVVTENKDFLQSKNMSYVMSQINHPYFIKVHRSYVVNISKITGVTGNILELGKHTVKISDSMRDEVLARLNILK